MISIKKAIDATAMEDSLEDKLAKYTAAILEQARQEIIDVMFQEQLPGSYFIAEHHFDVQK